MNHTVRNDADSRLVTQTKNPDNIDLTNHTELTIHDIDKIDLLFNKSATLCSDVRFENDSKSSLKHDQRNYGLRPDSHVIRYYLYLKSQARLKYT